MREIGIAEIAVEEMEQRPNALDAERDVARGGRPEIIVDERRIGERDARRRCEAFAERRRALIAEALERETAYARAVR